MPSPEGALHKAAFTESQLLDMIAQWAGPERVPKHLRILADSTDFFRVDYDDVFLLEAHPYFIRNYEREGRFGIDEEPKFWVRRALDLLDGKVKILKFVFTEKFEARIGQVVYECVRSPKKEARILEMVRGHPNFMQGFAVQDSAGNVVRVVDYVSGVTLADHVAELGKDHEDYFFHHFPDVLDEFMDAVAAIRFLHDHGEKHGDIRRDHVIRRHDSGKCVWIDFDYNYYHKEHVFGYDLYGLGNILAYLAGRGDVTVSSLSKHKPGILATLREEDMNIIFRNRVVNLKKVHPYIPDALNLILMHFSAGAEVFYDDTMQLLEDLSEARSELRRSS